MKYITATLLTLALSLPVMALDLNGNSDFTNTYDSKKGKVLFPHGLHAEKLSDQCNFCHSAFRTFGGVSQMYGHKICGNCHEQRGGPAACEACHHTE